MKKYSNDCDGGQQGISPYDDTPPAPVKCYWCDNGISHDDITIYYDGKPHHIECAIENSNDSKSLP
jgi:hypothetical protein